MTTKLENILKRYEKLGETLAAPDATADMAEYKKLTKEYSDLQETAEKYMEYKKILDEKSAAEESLNGETDPEMKELLVQEVKELKQKSEETLAELKILLIPKDPDDDKNVIVEIRAGAGGEEAALFAYELYRMYVNYADKHRWKSEEIDSNETELGGIKEVTFSISGKGVYAKMKYESGRASRSTRAGNRVARQNSNLYRNSCGFARS